MARTKQSMGPPKSDSHAKGWAMRRDEERCRRVARRRDLRRRLIEHAHFVGKLSLALKTWYVEVSFRPGHSGAEATALHFSSIAEKGDEEDE